MIILINAHRRRHCIDSRFAIESADIESKIRSFLEYNLIAEIPKNISLSGNFQYMLQTLRNQCHD